LEKRKIFFEKNKKTLENLLTLENASAIILSEVREMNLQNKLAYDYSELLGKLRAKKITQEELAKKIHLNPSTLNQKLNNKSDFSQTEMRNICRVLEVPIENIVSYFFAS
jgi:DNA-binding XRE family transcriptional regulator